MESNLEELRSSCNFCCNLQKKILQNEIIKINEKFINIFEVNLRTLVTLVLKRICYINECQWNYWNLSCNAILHIYKKMVQDSNNTFLKDELKNSFQIYFELLHQIEMDCLHFFDGEVRNEGEDQDVTLYCSSMNRSKNVDGCTKYGINALVGKSSFNNYSCVSIDGLKTLCIHLFHFANINEITLTNNYNFKDVELLIDACCHDIIASQNKVRNQKSLEGDKKFGSLIEIVRSKRFDISYSIVIRAEKVFI